MTFSNRADQPTQFVLHWKGKCIIYTSIQKKINEHSASCPTLILFTTTQPQKTNLGTTKTTQTKSIKHPSSLTSNQRETRTHRYTSSWVKKKHNLHRKPGPPPILASNTGPPELRTAQKTKQKTTKKNSYTNQSETTTHHTSRWKKKKGKPKNCIKLSVWSLPNRSQVTTFRNYTNKETHNKTKSIFLNQHQLWWS